MRRCSDICLFAQTMTSKFRQIPDLGVSWMPLVSPKMLSTASGPDASLVSWDVSKWLFLVCLQSATSHV